MDIVIEEEVLVNSSHDMPNSRRKDKKLITKKPSQALKLKKQETSTQMEALKAIILSDAEMQANKIAFIKEAIAEGRYEMHCEKVAEKMLADALI